ncbi:hypothetical protein D3OALGA1CA_4616 [Olavius algarvensis associated proteobacterium Delta 3]|nr:hypothetical protein D3OALGA1CA_4616 [Olavius algarvensis associated proteobacterium Delta 3]
MLARLWRAGFWILDTGYWILDTRSFCEREMGLRMSGKRLSPTELTEFTEKQSLWKGSEEIVVEELNAQR